MPLQTPVGRDGKRRDMITAKTPSPSPTKKPLDPSDRPAREEDFERGRDLPVKKGYDYDIPDKEDPKKKTK
jgi:hypothetical protein